MFCAPTATLEPFAASITVGSRTGDGKRAISSRVCPATMGRNASTKAFASEGVLYIFQLAAISFLRDILCGVLKMILSDQKWAGGDGKHTGGMAKRTLLPISFLCRVEQRR